MIRDALSTDRQAPLECKYVNIMHETHLPISRYDRVSINTLLMLILYHMNVKQRKEKQDDEWQGVCVCVSVYGRGASKEGEPGVTRSVGHCTCRLQAAGSNLRMRTHSEDQHVQAEPLSTAVRSTSEN